MSPLAGRYRSPRILQVSSDQTNNNVQRTTLPTKNRAISRTVTAENQMFFTAKYWPNKLFYHGQTQNIIINSLKFELVCSNYQLISCQHDRWTPITTSTWWSPSFYAIFSRTFSFNVKLNLLLRFCPISNQRFPVRFVLHATGGDPTHRNSIESHTKKKYFTAHAQRDCSFGRACSKRKQDGFDIRAEVSEARRHFAGWLSFHISVLPSDRGWK